VDRRLSLLAAKHHGVFSRSQAVTAGASRGVINRRLAKRSWEPLYPGVYRFAGAPNSWPQQLVAACLAAGDGSAVSHRAAAALWRISGGDERILEVSVPKPRRARCRGVLVHQVGGLAKVDITILDAITVTSCTRTLIDLASVVPAETLEEALDDALRRRLTNLSRLGRRIDELGRKGRPGIGVLCGFMKTREQGGTVPESVIETRLLRTLRRADLPQPVCQFQVRDQDRLVARVDFAYPDIRLAIEVDGYRWHSGRARWERDLGRRNALTARGWRVIHVTSSDLTNRPELIIRMIAGALAGPGPKR